MSIAYLHGELSDHLYFRNQYPHSFFFRIVRFPLGRARFLPTSRKMPTSTIRRIRRSDDTECYLNRQRTRFQAKDARSTMWKTSISTSCFAQTLLAIAPAKTMATTASSAESWRPSYIIAVRKAIQADRPLPYTPNFRRWKRVIRSSATTNQSAGLIRTSLFS